MNYNWCIKHSVNRESKSYYGVFDTLISDMKVRIYVSVTPTLNELAQKRVCFAHIYFETLENNISDYLFHKINDDIFYLLKKNLEDNCNLSKTAMIECYFVEKIPKYIAFTGGDYSFDGLE